jgi:hypothetical protein
MWSFKKPILTHILQHLRAIALKPPSIGRSILSPATKHPPKQLKFPTAQFGVRPCNRFSNHRLRDRKPHLITLVNLQLVPHHPRAKPRETEESYPVNRKGTNPPKAFNFRDSLKFDNWPQYPYQKLTWVGNFAASQSQSYECHYLRSHFSCLAL